MQPINCSRASLGSGEPESQIQRMGQASVMLFSRRVINERDLAQPSDARKLLNLLHDGHDRRRRASHQSSKRVRDGEPTPVEESYSAKTSCSVLNVAVRVFAETTPSFFTSRVLSTARTRSSRIKPFRPP